MATNKQRYYISLSDAAAEILETTSKETGLSKSILISILISKHLKEEKNNLATLFQNQNNKK